MDYKNNTVIHGEECDNLRIKEEPFKPDEIITESQTSHVQQNDTPFVKCVQSSDVHTKIEILHDTWDRNIASSEIKSNSKQYYTSLGTSTILSNAEKDTKECVYQDEISPESHKLHLQETETFFMKYSASCDLDTKVGIKQEVWDPNMLSSDIKCDSFLGTGSTNHYEVDMKTELLCCEETAVSLNETEGSGTKKDEVAEDVPLLPTSRPCTDRACASSTAQLEDNKIPGTLFANPDASAKKCETNQRCKTCGKTFKLLSSLLKNNWFPKGCKSKKCDKFCTYSNNLKDCMIHNHKKQYICDTCGKTFPNLSRFKTHLLVHDDKRQYKCKICEKSFKQSSNLKTHLLVHDDKRQHKCQICEKSFKRLDDLKSHLLVHDDKRQYKCQKCEKSFKRLDNLKNHLLVHEYTKQYKCNLCGKSFKKISRLKAHLLVHDDKRLYKCEICERSFKRLDDLKSHLLVHDDIRQYLCQICGKRSKHLRGLRQHLRLHDDKSQYNCHICGKGFKQLPTLKYHVLAHNDEKQYKCQLCEKSYKHLNVFKQHLVVHENKRQYKCQICDKSFKQSGTLKTHLMVHESTKQYKCHICEKSFKQLRVFKSHLLVHNDNRPFMCEICAKGFKRLSHLKSHLLIHNEKSNTLTNFVHKD